MIREILVKTLGVEPAEITPSANFFHDLGGESLDVIDMSFRCDRRFGKSMRIGGTFLVPTGR